jgi:sugar O-acyltransferase (sialic acid O-acetyltransferase NeuD family)
VENQTVAPHTTPKYVIIEEFRPKSIYVLGAGGFSKEVAWLIRETGNHVAGFVDQDQEDDFHRMLEASPDKTYYAAIGVGSPETIRKIVRSFSLRLNLEWPNLVHPSCIGDWERISFLKGCIVCAGNIFTTDILIGAFNVINLNSTLGHDLSTGDFCVINPNCSTSANVTLQGSNLIGVGSTILAGCSVGFEATLGAGAVLTKDIPDGETWAGVPAKRLGKHGVTTDGTGKN